MNYTFLSSGSLVNISAQIGIWKKPVSGIWIKTKWPVAYMLTFNPKFGMILIHEVSKDGTSIDSTWMNYHITLTYPWD